MACAPDALVHKTRRLMVPAAQNVTNATFGEAFIQMVFDLKCSLSPVSSPF